MQGATGQDPVKLDLTLSLYPPIMEHFWSYFKNRKHHLFNAARITEMSIESKGEMIQKLTCRAPWLLCWLWPSSSACLYPLCPPVSCWTALRHPQRGEANRDSEADENTQIFPHKQYTVFPATLWPFYLPCRPAPVSCPVRWAISAPGAQRDALPCATATQTHSLEQRWANSGRWTI